MGRGKLTIGLFPLLPMMDAKFIHMEHAASELLFPWTLNVST